MGACFSRFFRACLQVLPPILVFYSPGHLANLPFWFFNAFRLPFWLFNPPILVFKSSHFGFLITAKQFIVNDLRND